MFMAVCSVRPLMRRLVGLFGSSEHAAVVGWEMSGRSLSRTEKRHHVNTHPRGDPWYQTPTSR